MSDGGKEVAERLRDLVVTVGDKSVRNKGDISENVVCGTFKGPSSSGATEEINCKHPVEGNFVIVQLEDTGRQLSFNEIEAYVEC